MRFVALILPIGVLNLLFCAQPERPSGLAQADSVGVKRLGLSQPLPRPPGTIRLATYNVLNLFDDVDDPVLEGKYDDDKMATLPERVRALAEAIRAVDADIVALQEVESLEALTWFRDRYLPDAGYDHLASLDVGYRRGIECSVMSRFEITDQRIWPDVSLDDVSREGPGWSTVPPPFRKGLQFQRSPLMVEIRTDTGYELTIFSVHHKSGRDFGFHREAEALKITELLVALGATHPSRNIIVMGDFNAAPWDKSLRVYLETGMIDTLAHRSTRGEEGNRYKTHASNRVLDYVLLNSAAHRELVIGSPHVYGTLTPRRTDDWQEGARPPGFASDHYPVVIDLSPQDRL
ncbi:MAG: endonuclease/exonuclease/phosphatase family protein [Planctomycetota bacterium]